MREKVIMNNILQENFEKNVFFELHIIFVIRKNSGRRPYGLLLFLCLERRIYGRNNFSNHQSSDYSSRKR